MQTKNKPPDLAEVEIRLAETSLHHFVRQAWPQVEPKAFADGWHLQAICDHLEAVSNGQIRNLVINIPPRHTKSLTVSVMWPAWSWINNPEYRWMFASYAQLLSIRDSVKCRRVIQSAWYQSRWSKVYQLMGDQNAKQRYDNSSGGYRLATSVDGMGTGEGGDVIVVDDPHSVTEVESEVQRTKVIEWWDSAMSTRGNDPKKGARVIIMQRTHHGDLSGHVKEKMGSDYDFLVLPAEYNPKSSIRTSIGFSDPRQDDGELLWPERFGVKEIGDQKKALGSHHFAAQYNQQPSLAEGAIFKRAWFRFYTQSPAELASEMDFMCQSWDMTFKETKGTDFVCGQVWGVKGANRYLLDQVCERLSFTQTLQAMRTMTKKWPDATAKYVEEKANGAAVIDSLRDELTGLIAVNPHESKEARASAVTPEFEAGNVWYPLVQHAPWIDEHMEMMSSFPRGRRDDDVDVETQALKQLKKRVDRLSELTPPMVDNQKKSDWRPMSITR